MGFFRRADVTDVIRYNTPDGEDWVDLRKEFAKAEVNKIILSSPKANDDLAGSLSFVERFAEMAVVAWSMVDDNGKEVKFTLDEYKKLAGEASQWLDRTLVEHLQKTIGREVEDDEKKPSK